MEIIENVNWLCKCHEIAGGGTEMQTTPGEANKTPFMLEHR